MWNKTETNHVIDKIQHKQAIHKTCLQTIIGKLNILEKRLQSVRESRNNETKSSVGDKYETGRAMMQIEEENISVQQSKILADKKILDSIDSSKFVEKVGLGSVVITDQLHFYISTALGKIKVEDTYFYCISKASPIGKELYGKSIGDSIKFNNKTYSLLDVY